MRFFHNASLAIILVLLLYTASVAHAATERMPCRSSEAKATSYGTYVWVVCPTEGRLMPEGMEVHFQGDKRDYVAKNGKLVELDGPLGNTSIGPDPRVAELQAKLADLKAKLAALVAGM